MSQTLNTFAMDVIACLGFVMFAMFAVEVAVRTAVMTYRNLKELFK